MMAALDELSGLLQSADMAALQRFAELREVLGGLPHDAMDAIDQALQELDLDLALVACQGAIERLKANATTA